MTFSLMNYDDDVDDGGDLSKGSSELVQMKMLVVLCHREMMIEAMKVRLSKNLNAVRECH